MRFRKKPVEIEAILLTPENENELIQWAHQGLAPEMNLILVKNLGGVSIRTKEGTMFAPYGNWIIKGIEGEFYACDPKIFSKTYEESK